MGRRRSPASRGRTVAAITFGLLVSAFTVVCSVQIMRQVWAPERVPSVLSCRDGVLALSAALDRARDGAAAELGEREGLARFREALQPEWATLPALEDRCRSDVQGRAALQALVRLRYTEEDGLRLEAGELSRLRRKLSHLQDQLRSQSPR